MNEKMLIIWRCTQCYYFDADQERCSKLCCGLYPKDGFLIPDWCELDEIKVINKN